MSSIEVIGDVVQVEIISPVVAQVGVVAPFAVDVEIITGAPGVEGQLPDTIVETLT